MATAPVWTFSWSTRPPGDHGAGLPWAGKAAIGGEIEHRSFGAGRLLEGRPERGEGFGHFLTLGVDQVEQFLGSPTFLGRLGVRVDGLEAVDGVLDRLGLGLQLVRVLEQRGGAGLQRGDLVAVGGGRLPPLRDPLAERLGLGRLLLGLGSERGGSTPCGVPAGGEVEGPAPVAVGPGREEVEEVPEAVDREGFFLPTLTSESS